MGKIDLHFWIFEIDLVWVNMNLRQMRNKHFLCCFLCTDLSHLSVSIWLPTSSSCPFPWNSSRMLYYAPITQYAHAAKIALSKVTCAEITLNNGALKLHRGASVNIYRCQSFATTLHVVNICAHNVGSHTKV